MANSTIKFEYIQSNHFKPEDECDENTQKKGFEVLSDGFVYVKKKSNKDSNYWKCKHPKCKASLIKQRCSNDEMGPSKVFEDEQNKLFKTLLTSCDKDEVAGWYFSRRDKVLLPIVSHSSEARKHGLVLNPSTIMTDLELAAINAFRSKFPNIQAKACFFHFAQALFKNFTASVFFQFEYNNDQKINIWFRRLFCLSLVPLEQVTDEWIKILADKLKFLYITKNSAFVMYKHALDGKQAPPRRKLNVRQADDSDSSDDDGENALVSNSEDEEDENE
ncbi:unnamed protein product [Brachionus calyciflorus]|uniref:MULE transposase domain-containing protein n=1 Tax=Brachionus calyciflorus TaxID=104777 RepID=A0A813SY35_9BILA|nr:unnamed protein product [Brachionus calyciflorus]